MPYREARLTSEAVHTTAVVDVLGLVRLGRQLGQRGPRSMRRQVTALFDGHHFGGEYATVLGRTYV
jgi:hypothetical protein